MIDLIHAKQEFKKYVSNYDPENGRIILKIQHIERVANHCNTIATSLNLTEEEIKLAELIGIFHDIGRFEQVRIANTFSDKESGINHAQKSIDVLFENNYIRSYIEDTQYDEIIKKAVINHNRAQVEPNLSEKELLFSQIIRDADKLDILYSITVAPFKDIFWYSDFDCEKINNEVMESFKTVSSLIDYSKIKNNADQILIFFAYIYDLNFPSSLKTIAQNNYLDLYAKRIKENFKSPIIHYQVNQILAITNTYLEKYNF